MNKIFKTLKNRRTGASTAVSELQTGHTKGSGAKATVVAAAVLAALMSAGTAEAARWWTGAPINLHLDDDGGTPHVGTATGFAFGNTNLNLAAKTYSENVTVWNVHDYVFQFGGLGEEGAPTVTLDLDDKANTRSLFEQSGGFEQALVHTTGLTVLPGPRFSVNTMNGIDSNVFEQFVEQNNQKVALGRYLIGERAVNLGNLENLDGRTWDDFNNKGIRYDSTTFYTAAVLSELEVYGGQTLSLDVSGEQKWGAHLTGEGGVSYVGDNKTEDVVTIKQLYETNGTDEVNLDKDRLHLANDYTGGTWATNVTLKLLRENSLGNGFVVARNAVIAEDLPGAFGTGITTLALLEGSSLALVDRLSLALENAYASGESSITGVDRLDVANTLRLGSGSLTARGTAITAGSLMIGASTLESGDVTVTGTTKSEGGSLSAPSRLTGNLTTGTLEIAQSGFLTGANIKAALV